MIRIAGSVWFTLGVITFLIGEINMSVVCSATATILFCIGEIR